MNSAQAGCLITNAMNKSACHELCPGRANRLRDLQHLHSCHVALIDEQSGNLLAAPVIYCDVPGHG